MIPRYQRILFWSLIAGIFLMAAFLIHGCRQAHQRLTAINDTTPIAAPTTSSTEEITLDLANDADGSIAPSQQQLALPQDPTLRARALLEHLLGEYALPTSTHVLQSGPAVDDVEGRHDRARNVGKDAAQAKSLPRPGFAAVRSGRRRSSRPARPRRVSLSDCRW